MVMEMMMMNNDDDDDEYEDDDDDDDGCNDNDDDDEVDWLAWFSAKAVNSPLPNSPLSVPTKMFFYFNRGHRDGDVFFRALPNCLIFDDHHDKHCHHHNHHLHTP